MAKDNKEMRTIIQSNSRYREREISVSAVHFDLKKWRSAFVWSAVLGSIGGLVGLSLSLISLSELSGSYQLLDNVGALFLVTACLVFSFAAHCLERANDFETRELGSSVAGRAN